ncbi:hypothetical protein PoB_002717400 [Plakobranchus ocellatus]|uniref:Uncharacterized protein n=1 Tax=Plakobranchus ocellatus TaxID=259542 RepID=A0AAV4A262_9GAST|nr:hypothetical protein PoB_002717400 [Plakobranchus ocellatus]
MKNIDGYLRRLNKFDTMTLENGVSVKTSSGKMNKRIKQTNSLPVKIFEQKNSETQREFHPNRRLPPKFFRRNSCPTGKTLISPVYREKRLSSINVFSNDLRLKYPSPELDLDLFESASVAEETDGNGDTASKSQEKSSETVSSPPQMRLANPLWGNTLSGMRTSRRFSLPVTTLEKQLERGLILTSRSSRKKNEADELEERRPSLQDITSFSSSPAAILKFSSPNSGAGVGRLASFKHGREDSLDRGLRSLYMNSVYERKLQSACQDLDKQSFAGVLEHRSRKQQITKQHAELLKRSPSTDDWLTLRKCRTASLQERERESISRRFSRRARHFRAPKELQDKVSNIRSVALFQSGFFDVARSPPSSPAEAILLLRRIAAVAGGSVAGPAAATTSDGAAAATTAGRPRNGSNSEGSTRDNNERPTQSSNIKQEVPNSVSSRRRKSSEEEMAATFRQLHSIPPRVAEGGLSGLLNHSRRMSMVDGLQDEDELYQGFLEKLASKADALKLFADNEGSKVDGDGNKDSAENDNRSREIADESGNMNDSKVKGKEEDSEGESALYSDNESVEFSDLDAMSSDSEEDITHGADNFDD